MIRGLSSFTLLYVTILIKSFPLYYIIFFLYKLIDVIAPRGVSYTRQKITWLCLAAFRVRLPSLKNKLTLCQALFSSLAFNLALYLC